MSRKPANHRAALLHKEHDSEFLKIVHTLARYAAPRDVFADFCEMAYCAIAKKTLPPGQNADRLEARYMKTVGGENYAAQMPHLLALAGLALKSDCRDFLGPIAAGLDALNIGRGQIFTPPEVSEMMAAMVMTDFRERIADKGYLTLADPACGSGSMMLASGKIVRAAGFDAAATLYIEATDIAPLCFKMTYIQLSLANLNARVMLADSLAGTPPTEAALTPAAIMSATRSAKREPANAELSGGPEWLQLTNQTSAGASRFAQNKIGRAETPRLSSFPRGEQDVPARIGAHAKRVNRLAAGASPAALLTQRGFQPAKQ